MTIEELPYQYLLNIDNKALIRAQVRTLTSGITKCDTCGKLSWR